MALRNQSRSAPVLWARSTKLPREYTDEPARKLPAWIAERFARKRDNPPPMLLVYVHLFGRYEGLRAHPFGLTESYFWSARIILSEDVTPAIEV